MESKWVIAPDPSQNWHKLCNINAWHVKTAIKLI